MNSRFTCHLLTIGARDEGFSWKCSKSYSPHRIRWPSIEIIYRIWAIEESVMHVISHCENFWLFEFFSENENKLFRNTMLNLSNLELKVTDLSSH